MVLITGEWEEVPGKFQTKRLAWAVGISGDGDDENEARGSQLANQLFGFLAHERIWYGRYSRNKTLSESWKGCQSLIMDRGALNCGS